MLEGLRIVDLTLFLPGPMMTQMLADQGAEVIKIEPPAGDPARQAEPFEGGQSVWFRNLNRGKTSLALDLKTEAGRERLWAELARADVLVEGFRPGVMERLGFGWEAVRARHPQVIYCSISAFGQTGSLAHHPAHDLVVQALSGFLSVNDGPDGTPVVPGAPSADMAAGLTALSAVMMALWARQRTGEGRYLDIAMFGSLLPWSAHVAGGALSGGEPPRSASQRSLGGAAFYHVYKCRCGGHVALGGREERFVRTLMTALGREELIPAALAPAGEQGEAITVLRDIFATRTRDEWEAWFEGRDVAFAPVLDFREALARPYVREAGLVGDGGGGRQFAPPIRTDETRWPPRAAPGLAS
jgi:crotonobetainyl-CoA:carnitine CoA-transferase CaiB-like acyl-CoA transferase